MTLRLLTWNCCSGPLATKLPLIESFGADVAVIPECPQLPAEPGATLWFGTNPRKGLGVIARSPWRLERLGSFVSPPRWLRPVRVSGPNSFLLWAIWGYNDRPHRYVRGIHRAVDLSRHWFPAGPTVMLGDFNSHSLWDKEHPEDRNHTALVGRLQTLGLTSSYHHYHSEPHGTESKPTFFEYRHHHRPYHIDYCFLPTSWTSRISSVTVGAYSEWSSHSDHMPLLTTLSPAAG